MREFFPMRRILTISTLCPFVMCCMGARVALGADTTKPGAPTSTKAKDPVTFGSMQISFGDRLASTASDTVCGLAVLADEGGSQVACTGAPPSAVISLADRGHVALAIPLAGSGKPITIRVEVRLVAGTAAHVTLSAGQDVKAQAIQGSEAVRLEVPISSTATEQTLRLITSASSGAAVVRWRNIECVVDGVSYPVPLRPAPLPASDGPIPTMRTLHPAIEQAMIEWDWRMQDGISTPRAASTYSAAVERTLGRGQALLRHRAGAGISSGNSAAEWEALSAEYRQRSSDASTSTQQWEDLWRRVHIARRRILNSPLAAVGPLAFIKQAPGVFSHQLTQVYGHFARPGGGVFVLDRPGESMNARPFVAEALPAGSYQSLDVSYEGDRILFAYCKVDKAPSRKDRKSGYGRYYHLYEVEARGTNLRQLTDGAFDDFAPRYLPNGKIIFVSTRRQGWHRCGNPGCENYTLAIAEGDGSQPHPVSFHETQEWDPAVLDDGRVIYSRWDYVDRHAVFYEQLWTVLPDGSAPTAFYGNNTFNPVGTWEPRQVPGSKLIMATAAAHHAMTAGSIILVDVTRGREGLSPITRLTPDALFPESECAVAPSGWYNPVGVDKPPTVPVEQARWPGHCYRSPYPLSEDTFIVAYSYDPLIGEPDAPPPNTFGLYLMDRFGNKELLHRDLNISSVWPMPVQPRPRPAVVPSPAVRTADKTGVYFLQNVYASLPELPKAKVTKLRIVQVLPKSTPGANNPTVGLANASPGKQVLGTVPVESDGSACFRAPACTPLSFQALDERGLAVQVMRSVTYLQPGESASCVGCHESRATAPPRPGLAKALARGPSAIDPGPDGSRPLSYPILVQPVLDKYCVRCHSDEKPGGKVVLTGRPAGRYTASYNALAPKVSFSSWGGKPGDFRVVNSEPLSRPGFFGARASSLMALLDKGHYDVKLAPEDLDRIVTWMDANGLFYGTFDPTDQARQLRGERIAGPALE